MSYEFQSILYRTPSEMCQDIAWAWLSAGGTNTRQDMLGFLAEDTDESLADECIAGFGLDQKAVTRYEELDQTWMETREIDRDDIVAGFAWVRANFDRLSAKD